jgi:hypothetical protein
MLSGRRLDLLDPSHRPIRIVALADDMLGRNGRMVDAITAVGPGVLAEAFPFRLHKFAPNICSLLPLCLDSGSSESRGRSTDTAGHSPAIWASNSENTRSQAPENMVKGRYQRRIGMVASSTFLRAARLEGVVSGCPMPSVRAMILFANDRWCSPSGPER